MIVIFLINLLQKESVEKNKLALSFVIGGALGNILDRIPRRDRYRSLDDTLAENQRMIENMSRNRGPARRQAERWWAM